MKQNKAIQITRIEIKRAKDKLEILRNEYDTTAYAPDEIRLAREISSLSEQIKNLEALLELLESAE